MANLHDSIYQTRPPTSDTHNPQINKEKERESRLPFPRWPTAGRWHRSCPVGTCPPSAHVLRRTYSPKNQHTHTDLFLLRFTRRFFFTLFLCLHSLSPFVLHTHGATFPSAFFTRPRSQHVRSAPRRAPFSHSPSLLFTLPSPSALLALRPLLGVASSLRQSGADTPPSLVTVTGDFLHPANALPFVYSAPNHRKTFFLFFLFGVEFWRETLADYEPRLGLRGWISRHGACSLAWVVVGEVAL